MTQPIPMILYCPACGMQHIDAPKAAHTIFIDVKVPEWTNPPHRSHLCAKCGYIWRPADVITVGVESIETKGKNDSPPFRKFYKEDYNDVRIKDNEVAVDQTYHWRPMDTCPLGVKVQLLNPSGVALYGKATPRDRDSWRGWAPLPKMRKAT